MRARNGSIFKGERVQQRQDHSQSEHGYLYGGMYGEYMGFSQDDVPVLVIDHMTASWELPI